MEMNEEDEIVCLFESPSQVQKTRKTNLDGQSPQGLTILLGVLLEERGCIESRARQKKSQIGAFQVDQSSLLDW